MVPSQSVCLCPDRTVDGRRRDLAPGSAAHRLDRRHDRRTCGACGRHDANRRRDARTGRPRETDPLAVGQHRRPNVDRRCLRGARPPRFDASGHRLDRRGEDRRRAARCRTCRGRGRRHSGCRLGCRSGGRPRASRRLCCSAAKRRHAMRRCRFDHRDAGRTHACLRRSGHRDRCRRAVRPGRRRGRLRASRCLDRRGADRCRANRRFLALRGGCRCGLCPDQHRGRHRHGRLDCRCAGRCHANDRRLARCGEHRRAAGNPGRHYEGLPASRSLRDRRCAGRCHASRRPCATIGRRHRGSYGGRRRDLWCPAPGHRADRHHARHNPGLRLCGLRHGADDGHHGRRRGVRSVRRRGRTNSRLREVCAARRPGRATAADRSARDHHANRRVTTLGCRSGLRRHADCRRCENPHGRPGRGGPRLGPSRARSNGSGLRRCHPDARPRHRHHLSRSPDKDTNSLATATGACLKKQKKIGGEACCLSPNILQV